jgi:hypothetical protein
MPTSAYLVDWSLFGPGAISGLSALSDNVRGCLGFRLDTHIDPEHGVVGANVSCNRNSADPVVHEAITLWWHLISRWGLLCTYSQYTACTGIYPATLHASMPQTEEFIGPSELRVKLPKWDDELWHYVEESPLGRYTVNTIDFKNMSDAFLWETICWCVRSNVVLYTRCPNSRPPANITKLVAAGRWLATRPAFQRLLDCAFQLDPPLAFPPDVFEWLSRYVLRMPNNYPQSTIPPDYGHLTVPTRPNRRSSRRQIISED